MLRRLGRSLVFDGKIAARQLAVNTVAGSHYLPRALRMALYRMFGYDFRTPNIAPGCVFNGRDISIGPGAVVNWGCFFEGGPITVGANALIGMQVLMTTAHHDANEDGVITTAFDRQPIVIGDQCWIGARAVILPGVRIAPGTTVAAGAVVASDLETPGLYGGVPARLIRAHERTA